MSGITSPRKRTAQEVEPSSSETVRKVTKIHPFFQKKTDDVTTFQWLEPLGPAKSCLHGMNLSPKPSVKVAAFDLDGTLIKPRSPSGSMGKPLAQTTVPSWEWWRSCVPKMLKEAVDSDYAVVIISNQALKPPALKTWKLKILQVAAAISDVAFHIFVATAKDGYRKPLPGIWLEIERLFQEQGTKVVREDSFFVGDAAGRQYAGKASDFSSTDRKWALNIGISFFTPEEYFLKLPAHTNYHLPGFHTSSLPNLPLLMPTSLPLLPTPLNQEIVLFVGYPCLGKTTFYRRHFLPHGYIHINQDTLKSRDKCLKEAQKALNEGKSCVIDNTNPSRAIRKYYIDVARQLNVSTRSFVFIGSMELAWHNNIYRAYNLPPGTTQARRDLVPYVGFMRFRDNFEEPQLDEGLTEIRKVSWRFDGSDVEREFWSMWLQIDGK